MKAKPMPEDFFDQFADLLGLEFQARTSRVSTTWADLAETEMPIEWDWPGWLPRGFLTIVASQAGVGKSSLCLRVAASYMDGRDWPDGSPFTARRGKVLWVESEGSHHLNLQRLNRWGLDPTQIVVPDGEPGGDFKLGGLKGQASTERAAHNLIRPAKRDNVRLIILDSLSGLILGSGGPRVIRRVLEELAHIARSLRIPVLLTHHLRKRTSFDRQFNLESLLGSSVISQVPRLVWGLDVPDTAEPENRRLSVIKNNLAPFSDPLGFRINDQGLHFGAPPQPPPRVSQLEQAKAFLLELLADGPLPTTQVKAAAREAGLAPSTLKRAKKGLGIVSEKRPEWWVWELP